MKSLPLFKSTYSVSRSILTLDKYGSSPPEGPSSIVDIAKNNNLKEVFLVEDGMTAFLEAEKNLKGICPFYYGLRISICPDMNDKSEESLKKTSKIIVFAKNGAGYKNLIKIHSKSATDGFYYKPRIDEKTLSQLWDENNLKLCIPFYDSFIYYNTFTYSICCPNFDFTKLTFFTEDNELPFDDLLSYKVKKYASDKYPVISTKSIYYEKREDFKAYLTFRCIGERTTLNKPEFDGMSSSEFCFESWKEQNGNN